MNQQYTTTLNSPNGRHGFLKPIISAEHFIFGSGQLGDSPINPSGQWDQWLPNPEIQNVNGVEPQACVSFATLNCIETLMRQEFGEVENFSDRWLAWMSGTAQRAGNDPHTVAETLRTKGDVMENDWPIDGSVKDFGSFYAQPPAKLTTLALDFLDEFEYGHEWVPNTPKAMMQALTYSPINPAVYAWQQDPVTGYYIRPKGAPSEHDVMIYGYEEGKYWKVFDSYYQDIKQLEWNFGFEAIKRHTLHRQIVDNSHWTSFLALIRKILHI